jgi:hypothetical protein
MPLSTFDLKWIPDTHGQFAIATPYIKSQFKNARSLVGPPGFNDGSYGRWVETGWHILPTDVD